MQPASIPCVIIDNFLGKNVVGELLDYALSNEENSIPQMFIRTRKAKLLIKLLATACG